MNENYDVFMIFFFRLIRTFSVMIKSTQPLPVSGSVHSSRILWVPPLAVCSIATTTFVPGAATKSMAPPIPLTSLPYRDQHRIRRELTQCSLDLLTGIIQLARSPNLETCMAPRMVKLM